MYVLIFKQKKKTIDERERRKIEGYSREREEKDKERYVYARIAINMYIPVRYVEHKYKSPNRSLWLQHIIYNHPF